MHRKWSVRWCTYIDFTHEIIIGIERIDGAPQNDLHGNKTWMVQPITTIETVFLNSCVFHKTKPQPVIQIELFTTDLLLSLKRCGGLFLYLPLATVLGWSGRVDVSVQSRRLVLGSMNGASKILVRLNDWGMPLIIKVIELLLSQ